MTTWTDVDATTGTLTCVLPDPPIWARARAARKGWAEEPGHIVHGGRAVEAVRFYRYEGASFSGWIVREIFGQRHSDPIPNRAEALAVLLAWAAEGDPSPAAHAVRRNATVHHAAVARVNGVNHR